LEGKGKEDSKKEKEWGLGQGGKIIVGVR